MINVLNLMAFTLFITIFVYLAFKSSRLKLESQNLKVEIINIIHENQVLKNKLANGGIDKSAIEKSDAFLTFLNQSRDWAFEYIEEVQSVLEAFVTEIEPEINYFKEYGDVASMSPNYYSMKKIAESYDKLKQLLPKEKE
jgi:hypothetical protein